MYMQRITVLWACKTIPFDCMCRYMHEKAATGIRMAGANTITKRVLIILCGCFYK